MKERIRATELERQIMDVEEIRVVIRAPRNTLFDSYDYERKASTTTSLTDWYNTRLKPILGDYDADIIDGTGVNPHGRSKIETIRNTYSK